MISKLSVSIIYILLVSEALMLSNNMQYQPFYDLKNLKNSVKNNGTI